MVPTSVIQWAIVPALACSAVGVSANSARAEDKTDLLDLVSRGHNQFTDLATRYAHVRYTRSFYELGPNGERLEAGKQIQECELWQNGENVRLRETIKLNQPVKGTPRDAALDTLSVYKDHSRHNGRVLTLTETTKLSNKETDKSARVSRPGSFHVTGVDLWTALGNRTSASPFEVWMYEHLQQSGRLKSCRRIVESGTELIEIEKECERGGLRVRVDPARMFQPVEIWIFSSRGACDASKSYSVKKVVRFHESVGPSGITFPAEVEATYYGNKGVKSAVATTAVTSAVFGERYSESVFQVAIPSGYLVADEIEDQVYRTGQSGTPNSRQRLMKLSEVAIPKVYEEPQESTPWTIPYWSLGVGTGIVLLAWAYARRRRANRMDT